MKIDPRETPRDRCETSIGMLAERVERWFRARNLAKPWIADRDLSPTANDREVEVVLFGGFLRRLLESGNWTWSSSRIWVVSRAVRDVLIHQMGFHASQIGVIPREELFSTSVLPHPLPKREEPFDLVFAGRLSPTKNIRFLLHLVSNLQIEQRFPVRLHLCGEVGHDAHPDHGRREPEDHGRRIEADIASLPWTELPIFHGRKQPLEWPRLSFHQPVYVNLSTSIHEDFDVSLAQAREAGWPCLISDWGGHLDVEGIGVRKISFDRIASTHEPEEWIRLKARTLAAELARDWSLELPIEVNPKPATVPTPISTDELDSIRRHFFERNGPEVHWILREGIDAFADTESGREFFRRFRRHFGPRRADAAPWIALVNDLHFSDHPELANAAERCHAWAREAASTGEDLRFLSLRELRDPENLVTLLGASRVLLPIWTKEVETALTPLLARLPSSCPVTFGGEP